MTILIVDAMPVVYQSFATVGHFCTSTTKEPTGVRYGFLRSVRSWSEKFKARKTIICWDTPHPILKAEGVDTYKSDRVKTPEKLTMFEQIPALKSMLDLTYYTQLQAPGYEADDLCATVARYYEKEFGEDSIIVTVDRDSYSAVTEKVSVFLNSKEKEFITPDKVKEHFGVLPHLVPAFKAVLGDKSDNIEPLLKGDAADWFKTSLLMFEGATSDEAVTSILAKMANDDLITEALLNLRVTTLHNVPKDKWEIRKGMKDAAGLLELFKRLEFKSMERFVAQLTTDPSPDGKMVKPDAK